ncbi:MAG: hypothetical protein E3J87_02050 [Candidatus Cloacimonadota bacterium]|nr:MAG: hypothetical protein E3J87_02050 [Candidatus Cloacimonadota bacterium]
MSKPSWKSVVFDELHKIREELTKEMSKIVTKTDMERWRRTNIERLKKDGYKYERTSDGYRILRGI